MTVLARLGLEAEIDTLRGILIPFEDPASATRFGITVALVGTLMTKAGFSRSLVSLVVRDLMRVGEGVLEVPGQTAVISFEGTKLYVPGIPDGKVYDIPTLKESDPKLVLAEEPLVATVFNLRRAYKVCEGL